jgi:hypothetical protein
MTDRYWPVADGQLFYAYDRSRCITAAEGSSATVRFGSKGAQWDNSLAV